MLKNDKMRPLPKQHLFNSKGKKTRLKYKTIDHNDVQFNLQDIISGRVSFMNLLLHKVHAISHLQKVEVDNIKNNILRDFKRFKE